MSKVEIQSAKDPKHLNIVNPSGSLQVILAGSHGTGGYQAEVDSEGKLMVNTEMTLSGIVIDNIAVGQDITGRERKFIVDTDGRSMAPGTPRWAGVAGYDDAGDTLQALHLDASGNQQVIVLHSAPIVASIEGDGRRANVTTGGRLMVDTELTVSGISIDNVAVGEDILGVERKFIVDIDGRNLSAGTPRWAGVAGYDNGNTAHRPLHVDASGNLQVDVLHMPHGINVRDLDPSRDGVRVYGVDSVTNRQMQVDPSGNVGVAGYDNGNENLVPVHVDASGNLQVDILHSAPHTVSIVGGGFEAEVTSGGRLMVDTELTVSGITIDNIAVGEDILGVERKFIVDIDGRDLSAGTPRWAGVAGYDYGNTTHKPMHVDASGNLQVDVLHSAPISIDLDAGSGDSVIVHGMDRRLNQNRAVNVDISGNVYNKRLSTAHEVINEDRAYHKRYYEWDGSNNVTYMGETTNVAAVSGTTDCEITRYWYYGGTNNVRTEQKLTGAWSNRTSLGWSEA